MLKNSFTTSFDVLKNTVNYYARDNNTDNWIRLKHNTGSTKISPQAQDMCKERSKNVYNRIALLC